MLTCHLSSINNLYIVSRGTSANEKPNGFSLAELPQMKNQIVWASREFRKQETKRFGPRGSSANEKPNGLGLAGVPQMKN